ncbi:G-patch domain-containing protein [Botrytis cinerea]
MSNPSHATPARNGLSLYANLLDPSSSDTPGSITKGPVVFNPVEDEASKKPQIDAAALRFQPTRRPQLSQKPKAKPSFPKAAIASLNATEPSNVTVAKSTLSNTAKPASKSTLADWAADDDDVNGFYVGEKRQRGGRKRRKKNREEQAVAQDWTIFTTLHGQITTKSINIVMRRFESDDEESYRPKIGNQFAPPPNYSFAPPPIDSPPKNHSKSPQSDSYSPTLAAESNPPPPPPEDQPLPPPVPSLAGAISRAPVRYNLPPAPSDLPASEAELDKAFADEVDGEDEEEADENAPKSLRPGQKGFAERLMSKYGWSKGSGLGADGSGMITPLQVKLDKRKKKSDAEGGGFRDAGGRGKIIGGKKVVKEDEAGRFGPMSEVIVLRGMVDNMDLDEEVEGSGDGGLMQEIGDECGEKYGRVERVYIDRQSAPAKVFVKFTNQLSALRAVNALEGRIFNGNTISALFYDTETFEKGIYE